MTEFVIAAHAFAVKLADGQIDVRTISPTRVGAKVNWLLVGRGMKMLDMMSDAYIDATFERIGRKTNGVLCIPVVIAETIPT